LQLLARRLGSLRGVLVLACVVAFAATPAAAARIAAILSDEVPAYREALAGFQAEVGSEVEVTVALVGGDAVPSPDLVFAVGTGALREAAERYSGVSCVFCMVVDESAVSQTWQDGVPVAGVLMTASPASQMEAIRRVLPDAGTVGVIHSDRFTAVVDRAAGAAHELGLELIRRHVGGPEDIDSALREIAREADVLLSVPDPVVYSPGTAQHILLSTFQAHVPVVAFSPNYVKAGALFCLYADYGKMGAQAAGICKEVLSGADASDIGMVGPSDVEFAVNLRVARGLGIEIPRKMHERAKVKFE